MDEPNSAAVCRLFHERGEEAYLGEPVSQIEHALQAALLAETESGDAELVAAALVHDIGHVLDDLSLARGEDYLVDGDSLHEEVGHRWLATRFTDRVADCTRLHVAAKRYLCRVDADYFATLSPASVKSLEAQGGPMDDREARAFEAEPFFADAVLVRRWDDRAKDPTLTTPPIEHFARYLDAAAR